MLEAMRVATQGWIGRTIMAIVMGLIILSFAIWGIGDIFRGFGANDLAQVGRDEITTADFRFAYQTELQKIQRQARRAITNEEAKRFGLDREVLSRLVNEAALNQEARALGLALSDAEIARLISEAPTFKGPDGQFDRGRFDALLRDNGLNEKTFVRDQRGVYLRHQLVDAMTHGLQLPKAMLAAIHRFQSETREVEYFVLPMSAAGAVDLPSEDELRKYFEDRKLSYSTPELRGLTVLTLTAETLAKSAAASDADARKRYEEVKTEKYGSPEKRSVDQLMFDDAAAAQAARDKLDAGATFEEIVAQQGKTMKDVSLGMTTQAQLFDKNMAAIAFALPAGAVSAPVKTQFGTALIHVGTIEPASTKPFEEVETEIERELALAHARGEIARLHDAIEDQRASGKTLPEAAASVGLETRAIASVDASGKDESGKPLPDLPNAAALLKAAFASDLGVDNETLSLPQGGYQWFEVTRVEKARQKSFEEARAAVEAAWREDETVRRLTTKSVELTKRIESGEPIEKVSADAGAEVKRARGVGRRGGGDLPQPAVAQAFNVGVGGAGSARLEDGGRVLFKVVAGSAPPFDPADPSLASIAGEVKRSYAADFVAQYLTSVQSRLGVKINAKAFAAATGGADVY